MIWVSCSRFVRHRFDWPIAPSFGFTVPFFLSGTSQCAHELGLELMSVSARLCWNILKMETMKCNHLQADCLTPLSSTRKRQFWDFLVEWNSFQFQRWNNLKISKNMQNTVEKALSKNKFGSKSLTYSFNYSENYEVKWCFYVKVMN